MVKIGSVAERSKNARPKQVNGRMANFLGEDSGADDDRMLKRKFSKTGSDDDAATEEAAPVLTSRPAKKQKQATLGALGFKKITKDKDPSAI